MTYSQPHRCKGGEGEMERQTDVQTLITDTRIVFTAALKVRDRRAAVAMRVRDPAGYVTASLLANGLLRCCQPASCHTALECTNISGNTSWNVCTPLPALFRVPCCVDVGVDVSGFSRSVLPASSSLPECFRVTWRTWHLSDPLELVPFTSFRGCLTFSDAVVALFASPR